MFEQSICKDPSSTRLNYLEDSTRVKKVQPPLYPATFLHGRPQFTSLSPLNPWQPMALLTSYVIVSWQTFELRKKDLIGYFVLPAILNCSNIYREGKLDKSFLWAQKSK